MPAFEFEEAWSKYSGGNGTSEQREAFSNGWAYQMPRVRLLEARIRQLEVQIDDE